LNTLFDVKQTIRSVVGDDDQQWTPDSYLLPKINFAYSTQTLYIKRATGQNLEQVVEIPDSVDGNGNSTSRGRTSLAALQQKGGPLFGLYDPLYLWWKPAGAPETYYRIATYQEPMPFAHLAQPTPGGPVYWTKRSNVIFMTPIGFPCDLLVDGRFNPPPLVKDEDVLVVHPDMHTAVTAATIGLIGQFDTGNQMFSEGGVALVEQCADDIVALLTMDKQGRTARAGRANGRMGRRGWFWF
jgi:hypothetical protein